MENKNRKKYGNTIKNNLYMLKLVWSVKPGIIVHGFLSTLLSHARWVFSSVVFFAYIFGSAGDDSVRGFTQVATFIIVSGLVFALYEVYSTWLHHRYMPVANNILHYEINRILFEKAASVDISCYENPEFYQSYTKALMETTSRANQVVDSLSEMIVSIISSFTVMGVMFSIDRFSTLFVISPIIANFYFGKLMNSANFNYKMSNIAPNRKKDYVNRAMYLQKFSKEIRLSKITNFLFKAHDDANNEVLANVKKYFRRLYAIDNLKGFFCWVLAFQGMWVYAFYRAAITQSISLGDFVVLTNAIVSATWMYIGLTGSIVKTLENGLYIHNVKTFLEYEEKISENQTGITPNSNVTNLEFRNVSFIYDGAADFSLRNVNMNISRGERIALVGVNGAGKTTLVKLIMRLYDPTEGVILLNGIDIKEYDVKAYRAIIGTVFQDYQIMSMTVFENIIMNNVVNDSDRHRAETALRNSGAYNLVTELPNGGNTMLTREFDNKGIVLSGGQFQKIAVARAFAKNSAIMILDEPSSALDPVAEYQLYETIGELCGQGENGNARIGIFISHRLSSAVMADRVFMFESGRIIESGSHTELLKMQGRYHEMYMTQAQRYLSGEEII